MACVRLNESSGFDVAYEFVRNLISLLQNSFENSQYGSSVLTEKLRTSTSLKTTPRKASTTPIFLAMQLVSATAAFHQTCSFSGERQKYFQTESDRVMSKVPHDSVRWSVSMLFQTRTLIIQTIIALCFAVLEDDGNFKEIIESDMIDALNTAIKVLIQDPSSSDIRDSKTNRAMSEKRPSSQENFPCVEVTAPEVAASDLEAKRGERADFVYFTMKNFFDAASGSVGSPATSPKELTDVVLLLQEFDRSGGYILFQKAFLALNDFQLQAADKDESKANQQPELSTSRKSPTREPHGDSTVRSELSTGASQAHKHTVSRNANSEIKIKRLLKSWEEVIRAVKRAKTEYIHQVTCLKRTHRHCELPTALHEHHDIMGISSLKMNRVKEPRQANKAGLRKNVLGSDSPKGKSRNKQRFTPAEEDVPALCVAFKAVEFLVYELLPLGKSCTKLVVTSLDRVGQCRCSMPGYVLLPVLSFLPSLSPEVQDSALAVLGRLLMQWSVCGKARDRKSQDNESEIPDADFVTVEVEDELISRVKSFNETDQPSVFHTSKKQESENPYRNLFVSNEDHFWTCLALYRDLLIENRDDVHSSMRNPWIPSKSFTSLSQKVAHHLSTVAPYLELKAAMTLLTTVILPVLNVASESCVAKLSQKHKFRPKRRSCDIDALDSIRTSSRDVLPSVVTHCLTVLSFHLDKSAEFRRAFIKHHGMKSVIELLLGLGLSFNDVSDQGGVSKNDILNLCSSALTALLTNQTSLKKVAKTLLVKVQDGRDNELGSSPSLKMKKIEENLEEKRDSGVVKSIFKGFSSFTHAGRSPKQKRKSPFKLGSKRVSADQSHEGEPDTGCDSGVGWSERADNEIATFHCDIRHFTSSLLHAVSELTLTEDAEPVFFSLDLNPGISSESIYVADIKDNMEGPSSSSDTTGYQSRSRDSSFDTELPDRRKSKQTDAFGDDMSELDLDIDAIRLPVRDLEKLSDLSELCRLLSTILQDNNELQICFSRYDGPEMALRLLTIVTTSLISPHGSHAADVSATSGEISPNSSLIRSGEEPCDRKVSIDDDLTSSTSTLMEGLPPIVVDTVPQESRSRQASGTGSLMAEISLTEFVSIAKEKSDAGLTNGRLSVPEKTSSQEAVDTQDVVNLKFKILSSTLSMALLSTRINTHQHDVTSGDIISTIKPLLQQSTLTKSAHCLALCRSLFRAAVRSQHSVTLPTSVGTVMTSLRQQIASPRKSQLSPGYGRFSMSCLHESPRRYKPSRRKTTPRSRESESDSYEGDDTSSIYDMMMNIERELDSDDGTTDGYQGDSESDNQDTFVASSSPITESRDSELLVKPGSLIHPELTVLIVQLLGGSGDSFGNAGTAHEAITEEEHKNNVHAVLTTIITLVNWSQENLNILINVCDLPLACLESFKHLLQKDNEQEEGIRQMLLDLCLSLNKHKMSARHLRLLLSLFNSSNPPLNQLLHHFQSLMQNELPGPSQFLHFPCEKDATNSKERNRLSASSKDFEEQLDLHTLSVWKVAPVRLSAASCVTWPVSDVGATISMWVKVGSSELKVENVRHYGQESIFTQSQFVEIDIENVNRPTTQHPYYHLVSYGTKQTMLQVWLEHRTLIFRVCVDPDDGKPVGVLAKTECAGILTSGEWQHLTLTYTESKLPDKTILGKAYVIVNCTTERVAILEYNLPKPGGKANQTSRNLFYEMPEVNLFIGHCIRAPSREFVSIDDNQHYCTGSVMLFNNIRFSLKAAFSIYCLGPNACNLMDYLVCDSHENDERSSTSASSRILYSSQTLGSLSSDTIKHPVHYSLLPHSLLLSDLIPDDYLLAKCIPDLRNLQEQLVLSYSPTDPNIYLLNNSHRSTQHAKSDRKSRSFFWAPAPSSSEASSEAFDSLTQHCTKMSIKKLTRIKTYWKKGLHRALNQVGGIQVFLLLAAKVVEATASKLKIDSTLQEKRDAEETQCLALQALLRLRTTDSKRQHEFLSGSVAAMLHKLFTKHQCIVGYRTLKIIFNSACSGDEVIVNFSENEHDDTESYEVNFENSALLHDQELLQVFLTDWRIWHKSIDLDADRESSSSFPVWRTLLHGLLSMVREDHPYQWFNIRALLRAGVVHKILTGIQQMIADDVHPFPNDSIMSPMMELLRLIVGSPPDVSILTRICDFLVATHPPHGTFVCHASTSFYFKLMSSHRSTELNSISVSTPPSPMEAATPTGRRKPDYKRAFSLPVFGEPKLEKQRKVSSLSTTPSEEQTSRSFSRESSTESMNDAFDNVEETTLALDGVLRKQKTLSIIEEKNTSDSGTSRNSSRNHSPAHKNNENIMHESSCSWENLPHSVNSLTGRNESKNVKVDNKDIGASYQGRFGGIQEDSDNPDEGSDSVECSLTHYDAEAEEDNGLTMVTCKLLNLLFLAVMTMQEKDVADLLSGPLSARALVVILHHKSEQVRTTTVRLLAAYFNRCSEMQQEEFIRLKGFHLVANQLHQYPTTRPLVEACLYFLLGHPLSSSEPLPLDGSAPDPGMLPTPAPNPFTNHAAVLLLAVLENSIHDYQLCRDMLCRLIELFECMGPIADVMLDNGLTLALCNLVTAILSFSCTLDTDSKEGILEEVEHFMTCIAVKACVTSGTAHFQVFEDLFTLLYIIEKDQCKEDVNCLNVKRIQSLNFHILSMVLELMQKCTGGKSPMVPRKWDRPNSKPPGYLPVSHQSSRQPYLRRSSATPVYAMSFGAIGDSTDQEDGLQSPDFENTPSLPDQSATYDMTDRHSELANDNRKKFAHQRSISSGVTGFISDSNSVMYRPKSGGLRSRSFKGSQRRRINEAETARRLQRVVMISIDRLVFNHFEVSPLAGGDKETTFATSASSRMQATEVDTSVSNGNDLKQENHKTFGKKLFETLLEWLSVVVLGSVWPRGVSRSSRLSSSSSVSSATPAITSGWERILNLSRDSLIDQTVRLFTLLMSPWQPNLHVRMLPLTVAHRKNGEKLLAALFPPSSINGSKVSIYLYYLLCYYKQQMTAQEKKDMKLFCRVFHRCGHKLMIPPPPHENSHPDKKQRQRSPVIQKATADLHMSWVEDIQKKQANFDTERQKEWRAWRAANNSAYLQLKLRTDHLSQIVSQHAMDVTQQVVLRQNIERKKMIAHMKDVISNDLNVRKKWVGLLEQLAHERAVWYDSKRYPKAWQLDPTEGPNRERRRLQRCHLGIDDKFMLKKSESSKRRIKKQKESIQKKIREMLLKREENFSEDSGEVKDEEATVKDFKEVECLAHKRPLAFLFEDDSHSSDSITIRTRLQTNERISMVQNCTNVTPSCETPGEILVGESSMYFVGDEPICDPSLTQALFGECEVLVLSWRHEEVAEVHKRWWQLRDIAIEIFLTNGKTYLLAFRSVKERDLIVNELNRTNLPNLLVHDIDANRLTQMWRNGEMTNFEFLTQLNKAAGRSFNDLMQYPVFPFVLSDYTNAMLDMNKTDSFRNLLRPISIPDESRKQHYQERYKFLEDDYNNCTEDERELRTPPFHYGSHYSNSGTVLHFLVRLPPFTRMFLEYQDASFDIPDRTFHSMETTFRLSSYSSTTDVKELVPEFFFLPEFLCNLEGFDFGLRQCGLRVNHVLLPPWAKADPRLFILIHRQALESDYVSSNLHGWIDLVFGYKQTGKEAVEAVNVFHPATYFGMDISSVEDPVKRKALETMVKTYGQTPKQLFSAPLQPRSVKQEASLVKDILALTKQGGPRKSSLAGLIEDKIAPASLSKSVGSNKRDSSSSSESGKYMPIQRPLSSVLGLKWGHYLGSPAASEPTVFLLRPLTEQVGNLVPLQTNDVCALAPKMGLLVIYNRERGVHSQKTIDIRWSALLTYGHPDNIVRLKMRKTLPDINLLRTTTDDRVTCCTTAPDCRALVLGHRSGSISVHRCSPMPNKNYDLQVERETVLYGHIADITCLVACGEFRILASGSRDGTVILWDLDALSYIRSLTGHATALTSVALSRTSGDICTVCDSGNDEGSHIRLWTINGSLLAAQDTKQRVSCVAFSSAPEGISVNVVAGGMANGVVRLWSSWNLSPVRDIVANGVERAITSITYTHNSQVLYASTDNGVVVGWCFKERVEEKQPILISFLNVGDKN